MRGACALLLEAAAVFVAERIKRFGEQRIVVEQRVAPLQQLVAVRRPCRAVRAERGKAPHAAYRGGERTHQERPELRKGRIQRDVVAVRFMQQILRLAQRPQHGEHVAALVFRPAASERVPGLHVGARMILQIARDGQLKFMPPYVRLRVMREQRRRHARHAARVHQEIRVAGEHFPDGHIVFVRERIGAEGERGAQIAVLFFGHLRDGAVEQHGPVVKLAVGDRAGARQLVERVRKLVNHLFHHRRRKLPHMAEIPQVEPVGRKPVVGEKAGESAPVLVPAEHPVLHFVQRDILLPVPKLLDARQPLVRHRVLFDQPVGLCGAVGQILRICKERHGAAARPICERVIELQLFLAVIEPHG